MERDPAYPAPSGQRSAVPLMTNAGRGSGDDGRSEYEQIYAMGWAGHDAAPPFRLEWLTGLIGGGRLRRLAAAGAIIGLVTAVSLIDRNAVAGSLVRTLERMGQAATIEGRLVRTWGEKSVAERTPTAVR